MSESESLGSIIYIAVKPIIKIYMIIGIGFFLARKNVLTIDTTRNISYIVVSILVPSLTFAKVVTNIDNSYIAQIGTIAITSVVTLLGQGILTFVVGVAVGCPRNFWGSLFLCGLLPNIGDLPIAYLQGLDSSKVFDNIDTGVAYVCIFGAVQGFVQFNLGGFRFIGLDFDYDKKQKELKEQDLEAQIVRDSKPQNNTTETQNSVQHDSTDDELTPSSTQVPRSYIPQDLDNTSIISGESHHSIHGSELVRRHSAIASIYQNELRDQPTETMNDIIKVYSRYNSDQVSKTKSHKSVEKVPELQKKEEEVSIPKSKFKQQFDIFLETFISNTLKPASMGTVISVIICMVPWLKALFVTTDQAHLSPAPDHQPPLSFLLDFASYLGNAQVPIGLLMLGGTIGRLKIENFPKGLWKTPLAVTFLKLVLFPIIGCALDSKLEKDGLFYNDKLLYLTCNLNYALPPATSLLYFTAFYTPPDTKQTIQMDILALIYIAHYTFLVVALPFTITYTMKVALGF